MPGKVCLCGRVLLFADMTSQGSMMSIRIKVLAVMNLCTRERRVAGTCKGTGSQVSHADVNLMERV